MTHSTTTEPAPGANQEGSRFRLIHLSDLHFWHVTLNPARLAGKRILGMANLVLNRARKYPLAGAAPLAERIRVLDPDHVLVTGDLTTTSLEEEFAAAGEFAAALAWQPERMTFIPGNHDRYTRPSARQRLFERHFGVFTPGGGYPWLRPLRAGVRILGLDPCHPNPLSARGTMDAGQLERAAALLDSPAAPRGRLIVACHYPAFLPPGISQSWDHRLNGAAALQRFLAGRAPAIYCHGHIHAGWAFLPAAGLLCLNPGAAMKRSGNGDMIRFLEIEMEGPSISVKRHSWNSGSWREETTFQSPGLFG